MSRDNLLIHAERKRKRVKFWVGKILVTCQATRPVLAVHIQIYYWQPRKRNEPWRPTYSRQKLKNYFEPWFLVQGSRKTRIKLWTSRSTDQTGGDQKRREEKIKEKKERKSHCSTQHKPSHRARWSLGLRNRVEVGFHSTWAFFDWNRLYGSIINFFG